MALPQLESWRSDCLNGLGKSTDGWVKRKTATVFPVYLALMVLAIIVAGTGFTLIIDGYRR